MALLASGSGRYTQKRSVPALGPGHWRRFKLVHQSVCGHVAGKWVRTHLFCYRSRVAGKWVRIHLFCYESYVVDKYLRIECHRQMGLDIELLLGALRFCGAYLIMHFG